MNASHGEVQLPLSKAWASVHQAAQRQTLVGAILTLLIILLVTAQWPQRDSNAGRVTSIDNNGGADNTVALDYFSAQFGSPTTNHAIESVTNH